METITIKTPSKEYPVLIGAGAVRELGGLLSEKLPGLTSLLIITDETVASLHLDRVKEALAEFNPSIHIVPSGEKAKTFDVYYAALTFALEKKLDRKSAVIALGGGAVGDLAGFAAATFMRGIPFIQVPTTILAHDSAVGGKVGINHPEGKNMIGAFHQPEAVVYDLDFLKSLPDREIRSGFGEAVKHALIKDHSFYSWLLDNVHSLKDMKDEEWLFILSKGIQVKNAFVSEDEKEAGVRAFLNFGHTLGHAIEAESGYGKMTHGEAVVIGMLYALELSIEKCGLDFDTGQFRDWLMGLGYSISLPEGLHPAELLSRMKKDKKAIGQAVNFVLLDSIGHPVLSEIPDGELKEALEMFAVKGAEK
ncbi:MAG: 3-dehydroquinate synthase [Bacillota bacterium]